MQEHHADAIEQNIETHPVKLAIFVAIGAVALVIGIILLAQFAVGLYGARQVGPKDPAMSAEAVAKRIAPVAYLAVDPSAPKSTPAPTAAPAKPAAVTAVAIPPPSGQTAPAAGGAGGKGVYDASCSACHNAGVAGAPKLGDKTAWKTRLAEGKPHLYATALKGKGAMPPKGGNTALSDADVKAAVDYMVSNAK